MQFCFFGPVLLFHTDFYALNTEGSKSPWLDLALRLSYTCISLYILLSIRYDSKPYCDIYNIVYIILWYYKKKCILFLFYSVPWFVLTVLKSIIMHFKYFVYRNHNVLQNVNTNFRKQVFCCKVEENTCWHSNAKRKLGEPLIPSILSYWTTLSLKVHTDEFHIMPAIYKHQINLQAIHILIQGRLTVRTAYCLT